jgi:C-terminal processing protease CtpA/Prc
MKKLIGFTVFALLVLLSMQITAQESVDFPPAEIIDDEGGVEILIGEVNYTVGFLEDFGAGSVTVVLSDASAVVDRNLDPDYSLPEDYQLLGQVTSDPLTSPFSYALNLPIVPRGEFRDVDNDPKADDGVIVMTVSVFTDMFGNAYWEDTREYSAGFNSTRSTTEFDLRYEVVGGKFVVWAPDDEQGFPGGWGEDGLIFTEDDPIVTLPQGYTVVDTDTDPYTFSRATVATVDLIEAEQSLQPSDYTELSYSEAFDALVEQMRREYSFTELKNVDWDALSDEFTPRFAEAEANGDTLAYQQALREFTWAIPDGHVGVGVPLPQAFFDETDGGLGLSIRELDDGRVVVEYLAEGGPAAETGFELGTEIFTVNGQEILKLIDDTIPWSSPFSTEDRRRLQQMRYAMRFPVGDQVELTYQNPDADEIETVTLEVVAERDSWNYSSFNRDAAPSWSQPVEFEVLDNGYGYARINTFSEDPQVMLRLWEWVIDTMNEEQVPGLVIDMRNNGGGYNVDNQMAAYFFDEEVLVGNEARFYEGEGFYVDPLLEESIEPAPDGRYYGGPVAVLVGPNCASACESFTYNMSLNDRAAIVGHYTTSGLGGSITPVFMPDDVYFQFTISRALTPEGDIRIEGIGVPPTIDVPVDEETLFAEGDPLLDVAVGYLDDASTIPVTDGGDIAIGDSVEGELVEGERVQYVLEIPEALTLDFVLGDESGELDTVLRLYVQGNPQVAAENDDELDADTVNSALRAIEVPAGLTLIVEVAGFNDNESGPYTLSITESSGE